MTDSHHDSMHRSEFYIGGQWVAPTRPETIDVVDPSTEAVIGSVPSGAAEDIDRAVLAAREAFDSWSQTTPHERAEWMEKIAAALTARADEFAEMIAREIGMPLALSRSIQVKLGIGDIAVMPEAISEIVWEEQVGNSIVLREPIGVIGAITPWNYPLHQVTAKVAGALSAGCTVVVKPSEVAPLSVFLLAEVLDELGLPPGVVNVVSGDGAVTGEALVTHPHIDMISFTGSTRAGRRISELAASRVKPVALELGGKSASIILEDADLEQAIRVTLSKCYQNSGQTCNALTRVLVPRSKLAEAERIAADAAASYRVGPPFEEGSTLGPLASRDQRDRVRAYIEQGVAEGARLVFGSVEQPAGLNGGYFVSPTVFSDVTETMAIAREEIFGPVAVLLGFDDEQDAVRMANDSDYGLSGAVFSADFGTAQRVAKQLRTGQVSINGGAYNPRAPFGGVKQSGHGREAGRFGIEEFLTYKSLQT